MIQEKRQVAGLGVDKKSRQHFLPKIWKKQKFKDIYVDYMKG